MERRAVNPWTWQDQFGYVQANEASGAERVLVCSGQTSVDADGQPMHEGDMGAQVGQALDNVETVLNEAGYTLADVVRLNYYVTDVDALGVAQRRQAHRFRTWRTGEYDGEHAGSLAPGPPLARARADSVQRAVSQDGEADEARDHHRDVADSGKLLEHHDPPREGLDRHHVAQAGARQGGEAEEQQLHPGAVARPDRPRP